MTARGYGLSELRIQQCLRLKLQNTIREGSVLKMMERRGIERICIEGQAIFEPTFTLDRLKQGQRTWSDSRSLQVDLMRLIRCD